MTTHMRSKKFDPEDEEPVYGEEVRLCRRCKQEFTGTCPVASASCPMETEEREANDEEERNDFDDVGNLDAILTKDPAADEAAEEEDEIPEEDLKDDG